MSKKKIFSFLLAIFLVAVTFYGTGIVRAADEEIQACFDKASKDYIDCIVPADGGEVSPEKVDACRVTFENEKIKCSAISGTYSPGNIGGLINPLSGKTVPTLAGDIIRGFLGVVGSISLILFIYAGVQWMTARGNPEQVKSATKTMLWTVLGIIMIFGSYLILNFVFRALGVNSNAT